MSKVFGMRRKLQKLEEENQKLREFIQDLAGFGVRHDTNPTLVDVTRTQAITFLYGYIRGIDDSIRQRALSVLEACKSDELHGKSCEQVILDPLED